MNDDPDMFHLLNQISEGPLGRIMLRIASRYARTVQARPATTGGTTQCQEDLGWRSRARRLAAAHALFAHNAVNLRIATICEVARRLQRNEASIRGLMKRHPT